MCKNKYILPSFVLVFLNKGLRRGKEKKKRERKKKFFVGLLQTICPTSPPICKRPRRRKGREETSALVYD